MRDREVLNGRVPPFPGSGSVLVGPADGCPPTPSSPRRHRRPPRRGSLRESVPSCRQRPILSRRLCAVWNDPSSQGRSRHGEQVRYFHAMASRVRRWSAHRRPRTGSAGMSGSIRTHIASVITNQTGASDQLTNPSKRHVLGQSGELATRNLPHMPGSCVTEHIPTNGQPVPLGMRGAGVACPFTRGKEQVRRGRDGHPSGVGTPVGAAYAVPAGLFLCGPGEDRWCTPVVRRRPLKHPRAVAGTLSEIHPCGVLEAANRWAAHPTTGDHGKGQHLPVLPLCVHEGTPLTGCTVQPSLLP